MADLIKRIRTDVGDLQIDYNALANLPDLNVYATVSALNNVKSKVDNVQQSADNSVKSVNGVSIDDDGNVVLTPENIGALNTNKIVNNLTATNAGYVLDARQGTVVDTRIKVFENAMSVSSNAIDLKGKYLDNALFR